MTDISEPYCNHDAPAVRGGICECGAAITGPTLTIGMLRQVTAAWPDDTQIVVAREDDDERDGYLNIDTVVLPDEERGYLAITLYPVDTFDPRQF